MEPSDFSHLCSPCSTSLCFVCLHDLAAFAQSCPKHVRQRRLSPDSRWLCTTCSAHRPLAWAARRASHKCSQTSFRDWYRTHAAKIDSAVLLLPLAKTKTTQKMTSRPARLHLPPPTTRLEKARRRLMPSREMLRRMMHLLLLQRLNRLRKPVQRLPLEQHTGQSQWRKPERRASSIKCANTAAIAIAKSKTATATATSLGPRHQFQVGRRRVPTLILPLKKARSNKDPAPSRSPNASAKKADSRHGPERTCNSAVDGLLFWWPSVCSS